MCVCESPYVLCVCVTVRGMGRYVVCGWMVANLVCTVLADDNEPDRMASIPGMGIPDQLKAAMEQEQTSKY